VASWACGLHRQWEEQTAGSRTPVLRPPSADGARRPDSQAKAQHEGRLARASHQRSDERGARAGDDPHGGGGRATGCGRLRLDGCSSGCPARQRRPVEVTTGAARGHRRRARELLPGVRAAPSLSTGRRILANEDSQAPPARKGIGPAASRSRHRWRRRHRSDRRWPRRGVDGSGSPHPHSNFKRRRPSSCRRSLEVVHVTRPPRGIDRSRSVQVAASATRRGDYSVRHTPPTSIRSYPYRLSSAGNSAGAAVVRKAT